VQQPHSRVDYLHCQRYAPKVSIFS
jgi:hypothetical protein